MLRIQDVDKNRVKFESDMLSNVKDTKYIFYNKNASQAKIDLTRLVENMPVLLVQKLLTYTSLIFLRLTCHKSNRNHRYKHRRKILIIMNRPCN